MRWSPSTRRPVSSTASTRSASPSKARPTWAPDSTTFRCRSWGWVDPHPALMLRPSGAAWRTSTSAPSLRRASGATVGGRPVGAVDRPRVVHRTGAPRPKPPPRPATRRHPAPTLRSPRGCRVRQTVPPTGPTPSGEWSPRGNGGRRRPATSSRTDFQLGLDVVGELAPTRGEELDAVVGPPVVRRRDDRSRPTSGGAEPGHGRCRHHPEAVGSSATRGQAIRQRGSQARPGGPGVSADEEALAPAEDHGRRSSQRTHQMIGELVGWSPDPVRAESKAHRTLRRGAARPISAWSTEGPCGPS